MTLFLHTGMYQPCSLSGGLVHCLSQGNSVALPPLQTSLLRSLKPTERVVKHMEKLDQESDDEAENERKKQEAKELELDAFGF